MRAVVLMLMMMVASVSWLGSQSYQSEGGRKKKVRSATVTAPTTQDKEPALTSTDDPRVGTTKRGQVVYRGKKGGYYVLTPSGRKRYVKEPDIIFDGNK